MIKNSTEFVKTLYAFRKVYGRKPAPAVFDLDREYWSALRQSKGKEYAMDFERWLSS